MRASQAAVMALPTARAGRSADSAAAGDGAATGAEHSGAGVCGVVAPRDAVVAGDAERTGKSFFVEGECSICLDEFVEGEEVKQLPCSHFFHAPCIDGWLLKERPATNLELLVGMRPRVAAAVPSCPLCNAVPFELAATDKENRARGGPSWHRPYLPAGRRSTPRVVPAEA